MRCVCRTASSADTTAADEQHREHDRQHAQPPRALARHLELVLLGIPACLEELPLELVQLDQMLGSPVECRGETAPPVELRGVTAPLFPGTGGPHQVLVQAAAGDVVLEPSAQPGPFPQQGLVGDLDRAFADRQQTAVRELCENDPGILVRVEVELGEGCATSHRPLRLAGGKPQQHAASDSLLRLAQPSIGALGQPAHRAAYAAARLVPLQLERAPVPLLPELEERRRQKRERTRLVSDVGDKGVDEPWLDAKPCPARRQLDRPAQLLRLHRPDEHMVRAEQVGEVRVGRAAAVEGGPNREYQREPAVGITGGSRDRAHEGCTLRVVPAGRERLLELIHDDEHMTSSVLIAVGRLERLVESGHGLVARPQKDPVPPLAARKHARGERRHETCSHDRRLAASGGPYNAEQRRSDEPGDELGDESVATEEHVCVVHLEAREALERAQHVIQLVASRRVQARPLLHPLEVDDVALESEGRRQQVAVAHRGAIRRLGEPAAGLAACPFAHDLVDAGRNATGRREHGVDGQLRGRPAEVQGGDLGHRFPIERQELADVDAGHLAQEPGERG